MATLQSVILNLENIAPLRLAADWDSVGLLVGTRRPTIERVMACLSLTAEVAREAIRERAGLILTHHPLPFRPVTRITDDSTTGHLLLDLIAAGIGVYSAHTAWDSAENGINDLLAAMMELTAISPIEPDALDPRVGFGRMGHAPDGLSLSACAEQAAQRLKSPCVQVSGDHRRPAGQIGIVCGSGGESVTAVVRAGCTTLLTGEIKLHGVLEASAAGLSVIALGHYSSERFAIDVLAQRLQAVLPDLHCWASRDETDPLKWIGASTLSDKD